ncbi:MAG: hypothetical protein MSH34_03625 [Oscillospiraceae bacterium]|nr:hypothetical protein [Oscillospiraceae bacterium]
MSKFYLKDGEPFIPERINPELTRLASSIIKATKISFKFKLKSTSLQNALKGGDTTLMKSLMQKCFEKNGALYEKDMELSGVKIGDVDDSFFEDKDDEFFKNQIKILIDFACINTVVDSKMMPLMSASCKKILNKNIDELLFFTNQTEILKLGEETEAPVEE